MSFLIITLVFGNTIDMFFERQFGNVCLTDAKTIKKECALSVHYVNVGQGDCIMINLPDGKNMIIDAGQKNGSKPVYSNQSTNNQTAVANHVIGYAKQNIVGDGEKFDYMVLTHAHEDHVNILDDVLDEFAVGCVVRSPEFYQNSDDVLLSQKESELASECGVTLKTDYNVTTDESMKRFLNRAYMEEDCIMLVTNDSIVWTGNDADGNQYRIQFFTIDMTEYYNPTKASLKNPNNYSPLIVLSYRNQSIAFTGDGEKESEQMLISKYGNNLPDVNVFDLAHHGSKTGSIIEFVNKLSPEFAIVSVGEKEIYGLPDEEVLDVLETHNEQLRKRTFSTLEFGDIVVGFDYPNNKMGNFAVALSNGLYLRDVQFRWWQYVLVIMVASFLIIFLPSYNKKHKENGVKP